MCSPPAPPVTVATAEPLASAITETSLVAMLIVSASFSVTVTSSATSHPFASVTTTPYTPAPRPIAVDPVWLPVAASHW